MPSHTCCPSFGWASAQLAYAACRSASDEAQVPEPSRAVLQRGQGIYTVYTVQSFFLLLCLAAGSYTAGYICCTASRLSVGPFLRWRKRQSAESQMTPTDRHGLVSTGILPSHLPRHL